MPAYQYRAVDFAGRVSRGRIAAANECELAQNLTDAGLELIEARAKTQSAPRQWRFASRAEPQALARFSKQMADLLRAGISFPEALQGLTQAVAAGPWQDSLNDILRAIMHGSKISDAFARYARLFPDIYIAILAAGEKSGDLAATFTQLARYAEARTRMIVQLRRAVRYPLFLLCVALGVVTFMMTMVIPPIIEFLGTIDAELPISTKILIASSDLCARFWWMGLLMSGGAGALFYLAQQYSEKAALWIDGMILRLPVAGPVFHKLALSRFAQSFAVLFQSGIGVLDSMRGAGVTLNNRALAAMLNEAERQVRSGRAISAALAGIFPPFAVHMIRVGERSNQLGKALDDIAAAADNETGEVVAQLIGAMEPALTILIGAILAWIVLAVMGPIYGSLGKIGAMM